MKEKGRTWADGKSHRPMRAGVKNRRKSIDKKFNPQLYGITYRWGFFLFTSSNFDVFLSIGGKKLKIINVINSAKNIGKTTICLNLAKGIGSKSKRVLFVDLDANHEASLCLYDEPALYYLSNPAVRARNYNPKTKGAAYVLEHPTDIRRMIRPTKLLNVDLLYGSHKLLIAEKKLDLYPYSGLSLGTALKNVRKQYDYVIIDNGPYYPNLWLNSICCCDHEKDVILIPFYFNQDGISGLIDTVKRFCSCKEMYRRLTKRLFANNYQVLLIRSADETLDPKIIGTIGVDDVNHCMDVSLQWQSAPNTKNGFINLQEDENMVQLIEDMMS